MSRIHSGRRVKPESVPKVIRFKSRRKLLDYEDTWNIHSVSDRFRTLIEEIEPGVHQFEPVRFVGKDGVDLGTRWFWQICNRIDSVDRGRTNWIFRAPLWTPPLAGPLKDSARLVYDLDRIGNAKFWCDKHLSRATHVSDDAKVRIDEMKISGVHFSYQEQV